jgi:hypothetical protein
VEISEYSGNRDTLEQLVGQMIQKSIETGIVKKGEMIAMLEDMIQCVERNTLAVALEQA